MRLAYFLLASELFCLSCSPAPPPQETKREERKEERKEDREIRREVRRTVRRILRRRRPGRRGRPGLQPSPGPPVPLSPGSNAALLQPLLGVGTGPAAGGAVITALPYTCVGDQNGTLSSSISCTWSTQPPAGSSIVCTGTTWSGGSGTVTALGISDGTAFTNTNAGGSAILQMNGTANNYITVRYRFNIGVIAPAVVTFTITGATDMFANIACNAFTDTGTPTPDGTCIFQGPLNATPSSCITPAGITTTGNDYVGGFGGLAGTTPTLTAPGWTLGSSVKGTITAYQVQSSPGTLNPTFNNQAGGQAGAIIGFAVKP